MGFCLPFTLSECNCFDHPTGNSKPLHNKMKMEKWRKTKSDFLCFYWKWMRLSLLYSYHIFPVSLHRKSCFYIWIVDSPLRVECQTWSVTLVNYSNISKSQLEIKLKRWIKLSLPRINSRKNVQSFPWRSKRTNRTTVHSVSMYFEIWCFKSFGA